MVLPAFGVSHTGGKSPFSTPWLVATDTLRLVIITLGIILFFALVKILIGNFREKNWPNFFFILAMALMQAAIIDGNYSHLGEPYNRRLAMIFLADCSAVVALRLRRGWREANLGIGGVQSRKT